MWFIIYFQDKFNAEENNKKINELLESVNVLTEENKKLKKSNDVLEKNLSILLKTARAEISRKDSTIGELRAE